MKLCIAEKPSVAKEIAYILGAKSRKDGYFEGNDYCVTWTYGHLCTLKEPDDYQADWKKWNLNTLPILPERYETKLIQRKGISQQFNVIKKLCKSAAYVINCGDAGQEGELIQRWVLNQAGYKGKILRLWISSLTPEAIRDGFNNLKNGSDYDNLYYAGSSRAIGDWILGMNATRLYTLKYGGFKQVLSVGRVQTPTLAMLVQRHKEIENFVPTPYWELHTTYRETDFLSEKGKLLKKEDGEVFFKQVENHPFTILSAEKKKGKEYPPRLFDLTSLQVHCNKRFGYSADLTLKVVQGLYEKKLVTYPRVDTTYLPNDVYPKISGILSKMTNYSQFTQPLLGKAIRKSSKVFDDKKVTDHHAIIPTGEQKGIAGNELAVYDAICRQFLAAFYPDCIVAKTTVIGESNGIKFKATGKEILEEGWRVLFPKPKPKPSSSPKEETGNEHEERILPNFKAGETGTHEPALLEKVTQPPKNYTEATLLRGMETAGKEIDDDELRDLMKANGIGRPSTRANIIETLFRRKYVERKRKLLIPTPMGIQLIDTIQSDLLKSAELTGQWEKQLQDIERGEYSAKAFIDNMKNMVRELTDAVKKDYATPKLPPVAASKFSKKGVPPTPKMGKVTPKPTLAKTPAVVNSTCPKCLKGKLLKGKTAYGCSEWKGGCSFRLPFVFKEKELPEKQLLRLLQYGSTIQLSGFKNEGKKESGKLFFDDKFELQLKIKTLPTVKPNKINVIKRATGATKKATSTTLKNTEKTVEKPVSDVIPCPKCGLGTVLKGRAAYGCSHWETGCSFRYSFDEVRKKIGDRPATKALVWAILKGEE